MGVLQKGLGDFDTFEQIKTFWCWSYYIEAFHGDLSDPKVEGRVERVHHHHVHHGGDQRAQHSHERVQCH